MTSSSPSNPKKRNRLVRASTQTVLHPFFRVEIRRKPTHEEELEQRDWLKIAESAFDFWDNDEDAVYDHY